MALHTFVTEAAACSVQGQRCYVMWEHGMEEEDRVYFMQFPLATREVNRLMLQLLEAIDSSPLLIENLVNFLCATTGAAKEHPLPPASLQLFETASSESQ